MIAIPNMEMPKSCWKCELLSSCKAMPKNPTADEIGTYTVIRLNDCPLIEIPDEIWEALKPKVDTMSMALKGWVKESNATNTPNALKALEKGEPMEIYSGHEGKDRVCCNCRHNKRMPKGTHIECICDIDGYYIGYLQCFDGWCRHWAKERRTDEGTTE